MTEGPEQFTACPVGGATQAEWPEQGWGEAGFPLAQKQDCLLLASERLDEGLRDDTCCRQPRAAPDFLGGWAQLTPFSSWCVQSRLAHLRGLGLLGAVKEEKPGTVAA